VNRGVRESPGAGCLRLQEQVRLARKRFQLHKARTDGPGLTNLSLLFELERAFVVAENRLRRANPAAQVSRLPPPVART
jgi:hypothetical protein